MGSQVFWVGWKEYLDCCGPSRGSHALAKFLPSPMVSEWPTAGEGSSRYQLYHLGMRAPSPLPISQPQQHCSGRTKLQGGQFCHSKQLAALSTCLLTHIVPLRLIQRKNKAPEAGVQCRDQLRHLAAEYQLSESGLRQGNLLKKLQLHQ